MTSKDPTKIEGTNSRTLATSAGEQTRDSKNRTGRSSAFRVAVIGGLAAAAATHTGAIEQIPGTVIDGVKSLYEQPTSQDRLDAFLKGVKEHPEEYRKVAPNKHEGVKHFINRMQPPNDEARKDLEQVMSAEEPDNSLDIQWYIVPKKDVGMDEMPFEVTPEDITGFQR
jgi:hypothetical protein